MAGKEKNRMVIMQADGETVERYSAQDKEYLRGIGIVPPGETVVTLAKGGNAERDVMIKDVEIPDLWHLAMTFPEGSRERAAILETWHLAHDLKKHIAGE